MIRSLVGRRAIPATSAAVCLAASSLLAFDPPSEPLATRAVAADAVVQAVVRQIDYRLSAPTASQPPIPHTFVTFDVERVIRGRADVAPLTLRFQGGLFPDGRFLDDPTAPLFDLGERSILLVSRNGDLDVPLAGERFGRLRVVANRVYDDFGKPLVLVSRDRVRFGRTVWLDEVAQHTLGATGRSFNPRVRELPTGSLDAADPGAPSSADAGATDTAATLAACIAWLQALPNGPASTRIAASVDPNMPFAARSLPAVARRR
jgi:hypothetical protein